MMVNIIKVNDEWLPKPEDDLGYKVYGTTPLSRTQKRRPRSHVETDPRADGDGEA